MAKEYIPPNYNEAVMCPKCGENSEVLVGFYGILGGGLGPYTCCADCGIIVTKSFESHENQEIIEAEFTEIKHVEKDKDRPTD